MSDSMKHVSQENLGGPEVLQITATNRPEPGVGEILIRVRAAGINPVDTMIREAGLFAGQPPFTLGYDVSGTVEVAGPGVTIYQPGNDVFGMLPFPNGLGAYAEYVVGPARAFVPKPSSLDHISAAALPLAGLTAWQAMVETAEVKEGDRVLINGATGGVGHLAVQIVKNRGAHVIAMASTDNVEFAHSLGADEIIDYTRTDFTEEVDDLDVMLEVIGDDYPSRALEVLKPGGILVSTLPHTVFEITESAKQRQVRVAGLFVEADRVGMSALAEMVNAGELTPTIAGTFPLEQVREAASAKPGPGKVVLTIS